MALDGTGEIPDEEADATPGKCRPGTDQQSLPEGSDCCGGLC